MLRQNWFADMELVSEFYEVQVFYDSNADAFYIVRENAEDDGHISIDEITEEQKELYDAFLALYKAVKAKGTVCTVPGKEKK